MSHAILAIGPKLVSALAKRLDDGDQGEGFRELRNDRGREA